VLLAEGTVDEAYYYSSLRRERSMKSLVAGPKSEGKPARKEPKGPPTLMDYL